MEFAEEGGRIDSLRSDSVRVSGTGRDGREHLYAMDELALVRVEYRESNSVGTIVVGSAITVVALVIYALATIPIGGHI